MKWLINSKYLFPGVKQPLHKRLIRGLYYRYVNEPYFPEGEINFFVKEAGCMVNNGTNTVMIAYKPRRFVPGQIEDYFFNGMGSEITIIKKK